MPSHERIRNRLPSLYQPEPGDSSLLSLWLQAVGSQLDRLQFESHDVLQSHWLSYADQATFNPWFLRSRELSKPPKQFPKPGDPDLSAFPYVDDLARLGTMLPLMPWEQPPQLRDLVEDYRLRIVRMVALYRNGLGTISTLRRMVEAQLPAVQGAPAGRRDRPFWVEEFAPSTTQRHPAPTRGEPQEMVGPLMRWTIDNESLARSAATVFIQGVTPIPGTVDATSNPLIELYQAGGSTPRVALGYADTLAPGQTLRLRPSAFSWLGVEAGLLKAESQPGDGRSADPTAPGPWASIAGGPVDSVTAIHQSSDLVLWVATLAAGAASLHRLDGNGWSIAMSGLKEIHELAEEGNKLLLATDGGLLRMSMNPGGPFAADPDATLSASKVYAICVDSNTKMWFGTDSGAFFAGADHVVHPAALDAGEVYAIAQHGAGVLYFGGSLGLFQWQSGSDRWFWYQGAGAEGQPDWQPFFPAKSGAERNLPSSAQPFLPAIKAIYPSADGALWLGTDAGVARYTAAIRQDLTTETVLEAFPDVSAGPVSTIQEDVRGLLWCGTDRGLIRYDGRDWWQAQAGAWIQLGRADQLNPSQAARGAWRYQRASGKWQRLDGEWTDFTDSPQSTAEAAVQAIAWTAGVTADLGNFDGSAFSPAGPADAAKLVVRVKPDEQTIVDGGVPALPLLPRGKSVWRYLSLEPSPLAPPAGKPWWSCEGRLFPPPPDLAAPGEGRYDVETPEPASQYDQAVFAYNPAARVWMEWEPKSPHSILVRLKKIALDETIDPAIVDRVWQGIQQVRPAGVRVRLAVEEDIVKS